MNLIDILNREIPPNSEGEKIPWDDPKFSERMLREHLSQRHDAASRRFEIIDRHVDWIHRNLLSQKPSRILDLGCGPGFYLQRLAELGHQCVGIDFAPSSIEYARNEGRKRRLAIEYRKEDVRTAEFGEGFDLVMFIFGELNVFTCSDAVLILQKAFEALTRGGRVVLEVHRLEAIRRRGLKSPSWFCARSGLFSREPHLCLQENFWDSKSRMATTRYFIVDLASGDVTRHAESCQAYDDAEYRSLLSGRGFVNIETYPSLTGGENDGQKDLMVLVSQRPREP